MADNENVIGLAMQLDVTDIKAGIKEVNSIIKSSKDEFNNATAGMDKWSKSSEGLTAKLGQLGKQMDAQQKAVSGYEAEIERVKGLEGDHSAQLEILNKKLAKAQAEVKKTNSQISHYSDSLKTVSRAEKEAGSELGKLTKEINDQQKEVNDLSNDYKNAVIQFGKNSKEAKELAAKIKTVSKSLDENKGKVENADKSLAGLSKGFEELGSKALEKSVKGLASLGGAIAGVVGSFLATAEGTREFRTNMGKVDTAFKDAGLSAKDAEETYKTFYGVLGDEGQATEATALLGELANDQKDLKKWTDISTGVFAKFGDSLPVEGLIEAANETAKTGEVTGSLADALNWAGISQDDFQKKLDGCSNEQERQKLITETLSKTYGDASKQYKETNKDVIASQEAQAELSKAMAEIGERAEPIMTSFREMGTKILESLVPVLDAVLPFVQEHLPAFAIAAGLVTGAVTALATAIGILKLKTELATVATVAKTVAEKAAAGASKAMAAAQWLLNAAMSANPIGLVVIAITALVAAFVILWKKSDAFREFWQKLWEGIKKVGKAAIDAVAKFFSSAWDKTKKAWSAAGKFFSKIWDGIKKVFGPVVKFYATIYGNAWKAVKKAWSKASSFFKDIFSKVTGAFKNLPSKIKGFFSKAWDGAKKAWGKVSDFFKSVIDKVTSPFKNLPSKIKDFFSKAWSNVKDAWSDPKKFFSDIVSKITGAFKDVPSKLKGIGKNLVEGLWNGIKDMTSWITGKLKGFTGDVLGGIKKFFKVNSPSKETAEIGGYLAEGLAVGIEEKADTVIEAGANAGTAFADSFTDKALGGLNKGTKNVGASFEKLSRTIESQKAKLSGLESRYKSVVMTFGSASREAYEVGRQIVTLSREIDANEAKVKNLDDSYKNLNGTLANQMRVELNDTKNAQNDLIKQAEELRAKNAEAAKAGYFSTAKGYAEDLIKINAEMAANGEKIKELTSNLDYMAAQERKAAEEAKKMNASLEPPKKLNAYESLLAQIEEQKKQLESLRTEYESAVMTFGATSEKALDLANKIKAVTAELSANEQKVKELDEAYSNINLEIDTRATWQKFIDNLDDALGLSEQKLKKWSAGVGKYITRLGKYFDYVASTASQFISMFSESFDQELSAKIDALDKKIEDLNENTENEIDKITTLKDGQINALEESITSELETEQTAANERLKMLDKMYDNMELSDVEYRDERNKIQSDIAAFTSAKNTELANESAKLTAEKIAEEQRLKDEQKRLADELAKERDELARKQFESQKATSIAQTVINGAQAIVKGFADLGPIAGAINAGVQSSLTAAQIALIAKQQYVPALAKGGIADGATLAMIGEAGKEAVIPLERNTGWMKELAEQLSSIMKKDLLGGVQERVPAYAMAAGNTTVNNYYNQTINSPKALSRREIYRDSKNLLSLKG